MRERLGGVAAFAALAGPHLYLSADVLDPLWLGVSVAAFAALGYAIGRWWAMAIAVLLVVPSALFAAVLDSPGFSALCLIAPLITAVGARASLASHRAYANAE